MKNNLTGRGSASLAPLHRMATGLSTENKGVVYLLSANQVGFSNVPCLISQSFKTLLWPSNALCEIQDHLDQETHIHIIVLVIKILPDHLSHKSSIDPPDFHIVPKIFRPRIIDKLSKTVCTKLTFEIPRSMQSPGCGQTRRSRIKMKS